MKFTRSIIIASFSVLALGAVNVDLSTPKEAAKSVYRAVEAGDANAITQTLDVGDPVRQPMIDAMADLLVTTKHLSDIAKTKYGKDAERLGSGSIIPEDIKLLDEAKVVEKDGVATISIANQLAPLVFHKKDGGWKLDINDYFAAHEDVNAQTKLLKNFSEALKMVTADIAANKFSTAADAEIAIQQQFNEVMIKSVRPASTTGPTTSSSR